MERYKFLYELSRKALDDEVDRYKKLDEKASRFLSILSIGIVAYTALLNAAAPKIFPLAASLSSWAFVILSVLTFIALFSSWFRIFSSIKLSKSPTIAINEDLNKLAEDEELITMYYALALSCQDAHILARTELSAKTNYLESAYKEIQFSTYLLCACLVTYFFIASKTTGAT